MGGLARRVSYAKLFKRKAGEIPVLVVDSGNSFTDETNAHGVVRPDVRAKDDWILKAYDDFKVDVINVASPDLRYFSELLARSVFAARAASQPALNRLISANIATESTEATNLAPFMVRELAARDAAGKPVRIALVGLTEAGANTPRGFKISDPIETARKVVPQARKQADVVIVLAYLKVEAASNLAAQVPGIDAIIAGNSQSEGSYFTPPLTVGQTLILFTSYETRMLGEVRGYRDAGGKFSLRTRYITLDETFPDDEAATQTAAGARDAEDTARNQSKKTLEGWLEASRSATRGAESSPAYVSSAGCAGCHQAAYIQWSNSAHAHATDKLPPRWVEFETGCLACHATGQKSDPGGALQLARLQSVQCEQCHGPGGDHVKKPAKGYGRIAAIQQMCAGCHTSKVQASFDFQAAWAKIKH